MAGQTTEQQHDGIVSRDPYEPITADQWAALRDAWPDGARLTLAWRLARDLDTLAALLRGDPVPADTLNHVPLVRLEQAQPADLFAIEAA